jgi:hypothetical protein
MLNPCAEVFIPEELQNEQIQEKANEELIPKIARPSFLYKNQDVLAAGILFYTVINNKTYFLLRKDNSVKNKNKWSDLGGKSDKEDKDIYDIVARELLEESENKIIELLQLNKYSNNTCNELKDWIINSNHVLIYNYRCKYLLFKIKLDNLNLDDLKDIYAEDTVVSWKCITKNTRISLHPRLHKKYFKL